MLKKLLVKNFAIIEELTIEFSGQLNLITGETGAGKSILVGALSLLLGQKMESKSVFKKDEKCIIEGVFDIKDQQLKDLFLDLDLDYQEETYLRREINPEGKSRNFINDSPVNLNQLQELGNRLIDIHSQHETLDINQESFQMKVLDGVAGQIPSLEKFKELWTEFKKKDKRIHQLRDETHQNLAEIDFLQFQADELENAKLKDPEEQEKLEAEFLELSHSEEILRGLQEFIFLMDGEDHSILGSIKKSQNLFQSIEKYFAPAQLILDRTKAVQIELKDIYAEVENLSEKIQVNPARLEIIQARLNLFNQLEQKHKVQDLRSLIELETRISEKLFSLNGGSSQLENLEKENEKIKSELKILSEKLRKGREKVIPAIEKEIKSNLADLGMKDAEFKIDLKKEEEQFTAFGMDRIRFLFSANKGFLPDNISKVASGGELSRLVLSIKTLSSKYISMPTLLFDEIDTGVSGEVALKVGRLMKKLSEKNQVIAITHLPQIASREGLHFLVFKENSLGQTRTQIKPLDSDSRVMEIAKMLSGNNPGEFALKNSKELLENL